MKIVRESLNESWIGDNPVEEVNNMSSVVEMKDFVFKITNGYHFPLNPIDPLRSSVREKAQELLNDDINEDDKTYLSSILETLQGDWKSIELPPGAMH